jgi:hypothetical protein
LNIKLRLLINKEKKVGDIQRGGKDRDGERGMIQKRKG